MDKNYTPLPLLEKGLVLSPTLTSIGGTVSITKTPSTINIEAQGTPSAKDIVCRDELCKTKGTAKFDDQQTANIASLAIGLGNAETQAHASTTYQLKGDYPSKFNSVALWDNTISYAVNGVVLSGGILWYSNIPTNLNNAPSLTDFTNWTPEELLASYTINITPADTTTTIANKISAVPRNLGKYDLTLKCADGTYTDVRIALNRFYNGNVYVTGNTTLNDRTKVVFINASIGNDWQLRFNDCDEVFVQYITYTCNCVSSSSQVSFNNTRKATIQSCTFNEASISAIFADGASNVLAKNTYFYKQSAGGTHISIGASSQVTLTSDCIVDNLATNLASLTDGGMFFNDTPQYDQYKVVFTGAGTAFKSDGSCWFGSGGIPDAPSDGKTYGRNNALWKEVTGGGGTAVWTDYGMIDHQKGLNSLTNIGTYYGASTRTYNDLPTGYSGKAFGLTIDFTTASGNPSYIRQTIYQFDHGTMHTRYCVSTVWGDWVQEVSGTNTYGDRGRIDDRQISDIQLSGCYMISASSKATDIPTPLRVHNCTLEVDTCTNNYQPSQKNIVQVITDADGTCSYERRGTPDTLSKASWSPRTITATNQPTLVQFLSGQMTASGLTTQWRDPIDTDARTAIAKMADGTTTFNVNTIQKEKTLGKPIVDDMFLTSKADGTRAWKNVSIPIDTFWSNVSDTHAPSTKLVYNTIEMSTYTINIVEFARYIGKTIDANLDWSDVLNTAMSPAYNFRNFYFPSGEYVLKTSVNMFNTTDTIVFIGEGNNFQGSAYSRITNKIDTGSFVLKAVSMINIAYMDGLINASSPQKQGATSFDWVNLQNSTLILRTTPSGSPVRNSQINQDLTMESSEFTVFIDGETTPYSLQWVGSCYDNNATFYFSGQLFKYSHTTLKNVTSVLGFMKNDSIGKINSQLIDITADGTIAKMNNFTFNGENITLNLYNYTDPRVVVESCGKFSLTTDTCAFNTKNMVTINADFINYLMSGTTWGVSSNPVFDTMEMICDIAHQNIINYWAFSAVTYLKLIQRSYGLDSKVIQIVNEGITVFSNGNADDTIVTIKDWFSGVSGNGAELITGQLEVYNQILFQTTDSKQNNMKITCDSFIGHWGVAHGSGLQLAQCNFYANNICTNYIQMTGNSKLMASDVTINQCGSQINSIFGDATASYKIGRLLTDRATDGTVQDKFPKGIKTIENTWNDTWSTMNEPTTVVKPKKKGGLWHKLTHRG